MDRQEVPTLASCVQTYLRARRLDGYSDKTLYSHKLHLKRLALDLGGKPLLALSSSSTCAPTSRA